MSNPFSISPLPGALQINGTLHAARHKIQYVINNRQGLALLLGEAGLGKSSLLRMLEGDLNAQEDVDVAFIPDPEITSTYAFVRNICEHFEVPAKRSLMAQKDALKDFIFERASQGNNVVLLIDEAQGLNSEMLETVRGFLNYESNTAKLIQIILAGQLDLRDRIKKLRAVRSRVVMYSILDPLSPEEAREMVEHRCNYFGEKGFSIEPKAFDAIYSYTGGIPRDILSTIASCWELSKLTEESTVTLDHALAIIDDKRRLDEEVTDGE